MQDQSLEVCPWCDTELTWDPEIGPESICPHCENELGGYRSIQVLLEEDGFENSVEVPHTDSGIRSTKAKVKGTTKTSPRQDPLYASSLTDDSEMHTNRMLYLKKVEQLTHQQVEAPECHVCYQFMLFAGVELIHPAQFQPAYFPNTKTSILPEKVELDMYVCPTCFKVEKLLSSATRQSWMENVERS